MHCVILGNTVPTHRIIKWRAGAPEDMKGTPLKRGENIGIPFCMDIDDTERHRSAAPLMFNIQINTGHWA